MKKAYVRGVPIKHPNALLPDLLPYIALGFVPQHTSGNASMCGVNALVISLQAARELHEDQPIRPKHFVQKNITEILNSAEWTAEVDEIILRLRQDFATMHPVALKKLCQREKKTYYVKRNLYVHQLQLLLRIINKRTPISYELGVIQEGSDGNLTELQAHTRVPGAQHEAPVVWIHHTGIDHWQGMARPPDSKQLGNIINLNNSKKGWIPLDTINQSLHNGMYRAIRKVDAGGDLTRVTLQQGQFVSASAEPAGGVRPANEVYVVTTGGFRGWVPLDQLDRIELDVDLKHLIDATDDDNNSVTPESVVPRLTVKTKKLVMYRIVNAHKYRGTWKNQGAHIDTRKGDVVLQLQPADKDDNFLVRMYDCGEMLVPRTNLEALESPWGINYICDEDEVTDYSKVSIQDLRRLALYKGISNDGTLEELQSRLINHDQDKPSSEPLEMCDHHLQEVFGNDFVLRIHETSKSGNITVATVAADVNSTENGGISYLQESFLTPLKEPWGIRIPVGLNPTQLPYLKTPDVTPTSILHEKPETQLTCRCVKYEARMDKDYKELKHWRRICSVNNGPALFVAEGPEGSKVFEKSDILMADYQITIEEHKADGKGVSLEVFMEHDKMPTVAFNHKKGVGDTSAPPLPPADAAQPRKWSIMNSIKKTIWKQDNAGSQPTSAPAQPTLVSESMGRTIPDPPATELPGPPPGPPPGPASGPPPEPTTGTDTGTEAQNNKRPASDQQDSGWPTKKPKTGTEPNWPRISVISYTGLKALLKNRGIKIKGNRGGLEDQLKATWVRDPPDSSELDILDGKTTIIK